MPARTAGRASPSAPSTPAVSSSVRPPKKRSSTAFACRGLIASSRERTASSSSTVSRSTSGAANSWAARFTWWCRGVPAPRTCPLGTPHTISPIGCTLRDAGGSKHRPSSDARGRAFRRRLHALGLPQATAGTLRVAKHGRSAFEGVLKGFSGLGSHGDRPPNAGTELQGGQGRSRFAYARWPLVRDYVGRWRSQVRIATVDTSPS